MKPPNILVQDDGRLRLADFGVASSADGEMLARTGTPIGTPGYMALERWFGEAAAPCDVSAAGMLLHEMLSGPRPRAAGVVQQAIALSAEPLPVLPGMPGALTSLTARMTMLPFALPGSRTALAIQGKVGIDRRRHSTRYRFRLDARTLDRAVALDVLAESYEHGFEAPTPLPVELWLSDVRLEPIPEARPARP